LATASSRSWAGPPATSPTTRATPPLPASGTRSNPWASEFFGHKNAFTEIIGRHRPFGGEPSTEIHSRAYTSEGDALDYIYELDGDTLTIWGGQRGSDAHYTGTFGNDGDTLTGAWVWPGGGYRTTSTRQPNAAS
jgi:hypothetical protein